MLAPTAARRNTLRETSSDNYFEKRQNNVVFAILSVRGFGSWRPRISRSAGARPPRFRSGPDFISPAPKWSKTRGFEPISKMSFLRGPSRGPCCPRRRSAETPSGKLPQTISSNNVKNTLFLPYCWRQVLDLGVQGLSARLAPALHDFAAGRISNSSAPKLSKTRCFEPILNMSFLRGPSRVLVGPDVGPPKHPAGNFLRKTGTTTIKNTLFLS